MISVRYSIRTAFFSWNSGETMSAQARDDQGIVQFLLRCQRGRAVFLQCCKSGWVTSFLCQGPHPPGKISGGCHVQLGSKRSPSLLPSLSANPLFLFLFSKLLEQGQITCFHCFIRMSFFLLSPTKGCSFPTSLVKGRSDISRL